MKKIIFTLVISFISFSSFVLAEDGSGGDEILKGCTPHQRQCWRIVYTSENNFSEINLSNFSSGIYFYAVMDEKENVWRGRMVKE